MVGRRGSGQPLRRVGCVGPGRRRAPGYGGPADRV